MKWWPILVPAILLVGGAAWIGSDRIEQSNDFCNACHLSQDAPLHLEIRNRFDLVVPRNLAGSHGRGWVEDREASAFRCIDCHSGSLALERLRIKLTSARDGLRYAIGDFEEPEEMSFDLSASTCERCHPVFRHSAAPGWTVQSYHGRPEHDLAATPRCVGCHSVHKPNGDPVAYFMNREEVDRQCRECHEPGSPMEIPSLVRD